MLAKTGAEITSHFVLDERDDLSLSLSAMDKRTLIDAIARDLGASAEARKKWWQARRGVPPSWQIKIVAKAAELGEELAFDDFERMREAS